MSKYKNKDGIELNYTSNDLQSKLTKEVVTEAIKILTTYNSGMFNHDHEFNNPTGRKDYEIYFANGGDRTKGNTPEMDVCRKLDVTMLWGIGGGKIQSSSWLINGGKDE